MTEGRFDRPWGDRPYPGMLVSHASFWFMFLVSTAMIGSTVIPWFLTFELLGLWLYSRWLTGRLPYEEGATSDTMRSA